MLSINVQAEIIQSFQQEKRQKLQESQDRRRSMPGRTLTWRARMLRASGSYLITAGRKMQNAAGMPLVADRRLGWEK